MRLRRSLALALVAAGTLAPAAMAAGSSPSQTEVAGVSKTGSHSVRVIVKAPGDLGAGDVQAQLGGKLATIQSMHRSGPRRPLHLVFAVDTSTSMTGAPLAAAVAAGQRLLDAAASGDEVGLVEFDASARTLAPLTTNVDGVRSALSTVTTQYGTSLYDGVARAAALTGRDDGSRRVVVVLSDGADTQSHETLPKLKKALTRSGVEVDAVGLTESGSYTAAALRQITAATGGSFVAATSVNALEPIVVKLTQARLSTSYAVDIALPHSGSKDLQISVHGTPPTHVQLPAGVSGADLSIWSRFGDWIVILLGFAAVLTISVVVLTAAERRPQALNARLSPYSADLSKEAAKVHGAALLDVYETLERRLGKTRPWGWLQRLADRAGSTVPIGQIVSVIIVASVLPGLFGLATSGLLLAVPMFLVGGAMPVLVLRFRANRRARAFEAQLPELLGVWASALRAGRSFAQALDTLVEEASEPARAEFRRAQNQVRLGVPIEQALDDMSTRLASESFELVVLTTDVQRRIGGNVAEMFDQVADTVRKRQQFAARVRALVAMGVMSARVLVGMPFVLAGILTIINPGYMAPLYETSIGRILIVVALAMMATGALVLRRMVRPRAIA
jgi:tight adherence protein B